MFLSVNSLSTIEEYTTNILPIVDRYPTSGWPITNQYGHSRYLSGHQWKLDQKIGWLPIDNGSTCPLHVARESIDIDQCIGQYIDQGTVKDTWYVFSSLADKVKLSQLSKHVKTAQIEKCQSQQYITLYRVTHNKLTPLTEKTSSMQSKTSSPTSHDKTELLYSPWSITKNLRTECSLKDK